MLRQQINEQYGERVAIPYTSESPTSLNLQTGLPRLIKTQAKLSLDLVAIRQYFSSAENIKNFLLDLRLRTVMLAVEYDDGLKRAIV